MAIKNYRVTVLTRRNDPRTKLVVNILASSRVEARQLALSMYGVEGRVVAVV